MSLLYRLYCGPPVIQTFAPPGKHILSIIYQDDFGPQMVKHRDTQTIHTNHKIRIHADIKEI